MSNIMSIYIMYILSLDTLTIIKILVLLIMFKIYRYMSVSFMIVYIGTQMMSPCYIPTLIIHEKSLFAPKSFALGT